MRRGPWITTQDSVTGVLLDIHRYDRDRVQVEMRVTFGDHVTTIQWSREDFLELAADVDDVRRELRQPS